MNRFYSSLIINNKQFPDVHQVFKPRYNKHYFKRVLNNINHLEDKIKLKYSNPDSSIGGLDLKLLRQDSAKFLKLTEKLEKLQKNQDEQSIEKTSSQLYEVAERLMPFVISIPNRTSKTLPEEDDIKDETISEISLSEKLTKVLSHTKLSYINDCYSKSVVGPNSHYYSGIGAKLQYGLREFFCNELETRNFIQISGLCLTKSAVIESANSSTSKHYTHDPCRILTDQPKKTTNHLVEASRESMLAFLTTLRHVATNDPVRFMQAGAGYTLGCDWFDSDPRKVTQFETVHSLTLCPSIEQYSTKEYNDYVAMIWSIYKRLGLTCRLVRCSSASCKTNEFDAHRVDVWIPSQNDWIETARISHYLDYLTVRTGMKRGHIIDSKVYDGRSLVASIIENNQTSSGKFIIPYAIRNSMGSLSRAEEAYFFRPDNQIRRSNNMLVYNQRRYLKMKYRQFSHSKLAEKHMGKVVVPRMFAISGTLLFFCLVDWHELIFRRAPSFVRKFYYKVIFRPTRHIFHWMSVPRNAPPLPNETYEEYMAKINSQTFFQEREQGFAKQNKWFYGRRQVRKTEDTAKKNAEARTFEENKPTANS